MNTKKIGDYGELKATIYLKLHGYKIVERNYRTKFGEIDIIAYNDKCLCFIEVKTRSRKDYGLAYEAVNFKKQRKIINCALQYINENNITSDIRFDVVEVYRERGKLFVQEINLIKNAFTA